MFKKNEREKMEKENLFYFFHNHGFSKKRIQKFSPFANNFEVLATSKTEKGSEFISIYRHLKYPWFGTQFHPEKIIYEHNENLNILKSNENFSISRKFSEYFYRIVFENSNKSSFLDNRSVQLMKMYHTVDFEHKNVDEVVEWDYFVYYHNLFQVVKKYKTMIKLKTNKVGTKTTSDSEEVRIKHNLIF
jgi:gamma-glutamyl hydrolase